GVSVRVVGHAIQVLSQRRRRVRIVCDVQHDGRFAGQDLHTTGQRHLKQSQPYRLLWHDELVTQGFKYCQRRAGINELVGAPQGRVRQTCAALPSSPICPLLPITRIIEIFTETPQIGADVLRILLDRLRGNGIGTDCRTSRTKYVGLFETDLFAGVTQPFSVINVDTRDNGGISVDNIDGVQTPAKTDFKYRYVQA